MIKKVLAASLTFPAAKNAAFEELPLARQTLYFVSTVSTILQTNPEVCAEAENSFYLLYHHSCMELYPLFSECCGMLSCVAQRCKFALSGMIDDFEEGLVECEAVQGAVSLRKFSADGADFDTVENLCLHFSFENVETCLLMKTVFERYDYQQNYVAFRRSSALPKEDVAYLQGRLLFFRYLKVEDTETDYSELLAALSVEQITELWEHYLQDGVAYEEFERMQELTDSGDCSEIYKWLAALKLAFARLGIVVSGTNLNFSVTDQNGRKLSLGYNSASAADKLLSKLLFPK